MYKEVKVKNGGSIRMIERKKDGTNSTNDKNI